jgi:hypothetical protein
MPRNFVPCLPTREGSNVATCLTALNVPWDLGIKKGLVGLGMQLGLRASKARSHVTEVPARRAGRQRHHDLQTVQMGTIVPRYSATPA